MRTILYSGIFPCLSHGLLNILIEVLGLGAVQCAGKAVLNTRPASALFARTNMWTQREFALSEGLYMTVR